MTEAIGTRIKRLREERGLTQEELACSVVSRSYISKLESGEATNPTLRVLNVLSVRLDEGLVTIGGEQVDRSPPEVDPRGDWENDKKWETAKDERVKHTQTGGRDDAE